MYDDVFQARVWPIINDEFDEHIAPVFDGKLSENIATSLTAFPYGIYQSQDGGGKNNDYIDTNGWIGDVTIRCLDITLSGAWNKALEVATAALTIDNPDYDISIQVSRPIKLPVEKITQGSVYTAGIILSMGIYPKA